MTDPVDQAIKDYWAWFGTLPKLLGGSAECRAQIDEVLDDAADEPIGQTEAEARVLFDHRTFNGS